MTAADEGATAASGTEATGATAEKLAELHRRLEQAQDPGSEKAKARRDEAGLTTPRPVSYTHLTLPTICSV